MGVASEGRPLMGREIVGWASLGWVGNWGFVKTWGPGRAGLGWAKPGVEQGRGMEGKISPLQWGQDGETESSVGLGRKRLSIKTL